MKQSGTKSLYVTSRISVATKAGITKIAANEKRSISQVVALLVEEALQQRKSKEQVAA